MLSSGRLPVPSESKVEAAVPPPGRARIGPSGWRGGARVVAVALFATSLVALVMVTSMSPGYGFEDRLEATGGWRMIASAVPAVAGLVLLLAAGRRRRWGSHGR